MRRDRIIKKRKEHLKDFKLIKDTAGKICNGVYVKDDNSELIIEWAWGGRIHLAPQEILEGIKDAKLPEYDP